MRCRKSPPLFSLPLSIISHTAALYKQIYITFMLRYFLDLVLVRYFYIFTRISLYFGLQCLFGISVKACALFLCYALFYFVFVGRRGRRLPVAIVLRFDRVGRREPSPTSSTLALLARILYGSAVMFVKLARGWWSDTLPLPKKFRVQPSFFGNPIFFIHSVSIPNSALI